LKNFMEKAAREFFGGGGGGSSNESFLNSDWNPNIHGETPRGRSALYI